MVEDTLCSNHHPVSGFSSAHEPSSKIQPHRCHAVMHCPSTSIDLNGEGRMTLNNTGLEMSAPSPLLHQWINSYNGVHPLQILGVRLVR